ncbi:MAG TPA: hypothetical protein VEA69_14705 [Tepidisphaeraceae bacterium]|nr:hypothetical protein [Tepidisphaeraceae bacterium]
MTDPEDRVYGQMLMIVAERTGLDAKAVDAVITALVAYWEEHPNASAIVDAL